MGWRLFNKFTLWLPILVPGYFGLLGFFAAASSAGNAIAKSALDNQMVMLAAMTVAPYLIHWAIALLLIWATAVVWSTHKIAKANKLPVENSSPSAPDEATPPVQSEPGPVPSSGTVKDHFLRDFNKGKGEVVMQVNARHIMTFSDGIEVEVLYNQELRFGANAKFLVFYVPHCGRVVPIGQHIADNVDSYLATGTWGVAVSGVGSEETTADQLLFTRKVFLYHEDSVPLAERGALDTYFRDRNLVLQMRSSDYVLSCVETEKQDA